jgi:hypothetical protein
MEANNDQSTLSLWFLALGYFAFYTAVLDIGDRKPSSGLM